MKRVNFCFSMHMTYTMSANGCYVCPCDRSFFFLLHSFSTLCSYVLHCELIISLHFYLFCTTSRRWCNYGVSFCEDLHQSLVPLFLHRTCINLSLLMQQSQCSRFFFFFMFLFSLSRTFEVTFLPSPSRKRGE